MDKNQSIYTDNSISKENLEATMKQSVISVNANTEIKYNATNSILMPPEPQRVAVNIKDVEKIREICKKSKNEKHKFGELYLTGASLMAGVILNAITSKATYDNNLTNLMVYTVSPILAAGLGVAYFYNRGNIINNTKDMAERIEEHLEEVENLGGE